MEENRRIFKICDICGGSGTIPSTVLPGGSPGDPLECQACVGEGYIIWGERDDPDNICFSYKVLECLDATEHAALTDTQKDGVLHLLACGLVDLNDGKAGKTRLWNWFGAESTTVANLTALIG